MTIRIALVFAQRFGDVLVEPLGLCQLASYLRTDGHDVAVFDANLPNCSETSVMESIIEYRPQLVGISNPYEESETQVVALAREIRRLGYTGPLCLGGLAVTVCPEAYVENHPEIDFVVLGEGEIPLATVCRRLDSGLGWYDVPGLASADSTIGRCRRNRPGAIVANLDSLPFAARDILAKHVEVLGAKRAMAYVSQSRGCYKHCTFCCVGTVYHGMGHNAHRRRSMESVVAEMMSIYEGFGVTKFAFEDDEFVLGGGRGLEQVREFRQRVLRLPFRPELRLACRIDLLTRDMIRLLEECGLTTVFTGIEAFNDEDLQLYKKGITVNQVVYGLETLCREGWLCKAGSEKRVEAGFIAFNPFSTIERLRQNLKWVQYFGIPFTALTSRLELWNGTPIKDIVRRTSKAAQNGEYFDNPDAGSVYQVFRETYYRTHIKPLRRQLRNIEKFGLDPDGSTRSFREDLDGQAYKVFEQLLGLAERGTATPAMEAYAESWVAEALRQPRAQSAIGHIERLVADGVPLMAELR